MSLLPKKEAIKIKIIIAPLVVGLIMVVIIGFFALIEHFFPKVFDIVRFD